MKLTVLAALISALTLLGGCIVVPAGPGYYYGPGYYGHSYHDRNYRGG